MIMLVLVIMHVVVIMHVLVTPVTAVHTYLVRDTPQRVRGR